MEAASITHSVVTGRWAGTVTCGIHITADLTSAQNQDKGVKITEGGGCDVRSTLGRVLQDAQLTIGRTASGIFIVPRSRTVRRVRGSTSGTVRY